VRVSPGTGLLGLWHQHLLTSSEACDQMETLVEITPDNRVMVGVTSHGAHFMLLAMDGGSISIRDKRFR
jgi:hypothetical protein